MIMKKIRQSTKVRKLKNLLRGVRNRLKNTTPQKISAPAKRTPIPAGMSLKPTAILSNHSIFSIEQYAKQLETSLYKLSEDLPILIFQANKPNRICIGLKKSDIGPFAKKLAEELTIPISWKTRNGGKLSSSSKFQTARLSNAQSVEATLLFPADFRVQIVISPYKDREDDEMMSSNDKLKGLRRLFPKDAVKVFGGTGLCYASDIIGGHSAELCDFPIDVVYTWVNDQDPDWQELYANHVQNKLPEVDTPEHENDNNSKATNLSRFKNRDELKYSIRSIHRHIPWVRNIYVLTNCAPPAWLAENDRVIWTRHEDVFEKEQLPTFSSHSIETTLHLIDGLSENFIYFNDDFFINTDLSKEIFFSPAGASHSNLEDYGMVAGSFRAADPDYFNAARKGAGLIKKEFGRVPTRLHKHSPYALRKSVLQEIERKFSSEVLGTRNSKFRSATDISLPSFFYHHFALQTGQAADRGIRSKLIKSNSRNFTRDFQNFLKKQDVRTFCINDAEDAHLNEKWNREVREFLELKFPIISFVENQNV